MSPNKDHGHVMKHLVKVSEECQAEINVVEFVRIWCKNYVFCSKMD